MLRIILWILVIFLNGGILGFTKDKARDEPAKPIGDLFHKIMENLNGNYKDNIDADIANLKDFGHVSKMNGDFSFIVCKTCGGPMLGLKKTEADCKEARMDNDLCAQLHEVARGHDMFESFKARIDMREKEIECKDCGKRFESRLQHENHDRLIHDGKSIKKGNELEDVSKIMAGALEKGLSGIGDIFKDNKDKKIMTTQITKAKPPPVWIGCDFERFRDEVEAWNVNNADSEMTKYAE